MKRAGMIVAGLLLAQPAAAQLPPPPPPPDGGALSHLNGPPPPPGTEPADRREARLQDRTRPRGMRLSAIAYFDYPETTPMWTIESPVTGFGNEALWEDVDPHFASPTRQARASTARVASR